MDKTEDLSQFKDKISSVKDTNAIHRSRLSKLDKLALFITRKVGSMSFFFACVILATIPFVFHSTLSVVQYISSGFLQLVLLPLIMVGQNLQGRHAELRAQHDFETNVKAEKEIETLFLHLDRQEKMMSEILKRIEGLEKQRK
ncbi:MAG: DUF1003 domain-containing protein [Patescibacteria group bacterium]|nr:DUF1003 domain-containing protein [Patescibacteria group bacterium]